MDGDCKLLSQDPADEGWCMTLGCIQLNKEYASFESTAAVVALELCRRFAQNVRSELRRSLAGLSSFNGRPQFT